MARGRKITLKRYLKEYGASLADIKLGTLKDCAKAINSGKNPRCIEPMFLYALYFQSTIGFEETLNEKYEKQFVKLKNVYKKYSSVQEMLEKDEELSMEYKKVYDSFVVYCADREAETPYKRSLLNSIKKHKVTVYKMSKLSNLNTGNIYRFVKLNDYTALSKESAEKLYNVLEVKEGV